MPLIGLPVGAVGVCGGVPPSVVAYLCVRLGHAFIAAGVGAAEF